RDPIPVAHRGLGPGRGLCGASTAGSRVAGPSRTEWPRPRGARVLVDSGRRDDRKALRAPHLNALDSRLVVFPASSGLFGILRFQLGFNSNASSATSTAYPRIVDFTLIPWQPARTGRVGARGRAAL